MSIVFSRASRILLEHVLMSVYIGCAIAETLNQTPGGIWELFKKGYPFMASRAM